MRISQQISSSFIGIELIMTYYVKVKALIVLKGALTDKLSTDTLRLVFDNKIIIEYLMTFL